MKLAHFSGGLSTRPHPSLISPVEATVCNNCDISAGTIKSAKQPGPISVAGVTDSFYFIAKQEWRPNASTRRYIEYQDKLYWTDGTSSFKYDGVTTHNLGLAGPTAKPAIGLGGVGALTGVLQYAYTYYNIVDGTESAPSPLSVELTTSSSKVAITVTASPDPQTTHIFLYRIGASLLSLTKVTELPNVTATHIDNAVDSSLAIVTNNSILNHMPPANMSQLEYTRGIFYGAVGSKLYYTLGASNPNYWPATNYIDFRLPITGIVESPAGLLVFSKYKTWLLTGNSATTFTTYQISASQGCINSNTIAKLGTTVLFVSTDGICTAIGSTITVISKPKLGKLTLDTINAVTYDDQYFCQLTDGSMLVFDIRYEPSFVHYQFNTSWLVVANDVLYGATTGLSQLFVGTDSVYSYTTGELTEGSLSTLKQYKTIYIYATGSHSLKVYINGAFIALREFIGAKKPIQIAVPQEFQSGSSIQLEFTGKGEILEVEYKAVGRLNGK